jgi:hypothetical protein
VPAYEMEDGSLVLFGGTGEANTTATVGRLFQKNQGVHAYMVSPQYQSGWFIDATPTENPEEFVAIRTTVSLYPSSPGWPGSPGWPRSPEAAGPFFGNRLVIARTDGYVTELLGSSAHRRQHPATTGLSIRLRGFPEGGHCASAHAERFVRAS